MHRAEAFAAEIWQGDPFTHTHTPLPPPTIHLSPIPFSLLLPASHFTPLAPLPPVVDTQLGGDELTQGVKTGLGVLSPPLLLFTVILR